MISTTDSKEQIRIFSINFIIELLSVGNLERHPSLKKRVFLSLPRTTVLCLSKRFLLRRLSRDLFGNLDPGAKPIFTKRNYQSKRQKLKLISRLNKP